MARYLAESIMGNRRTLRNEEVGRGGEELLARRVDDPRKLSVVVEYRASANTDTGYVYDCVE